MKLPGAIQNSVGWPSKERNSVASGTTILGPRESSLDGKQVEEPTAGWLMEYRLRRRRIERGIPGGEHHAIGRSRAPTPIHFWQTRRERNCCAAVGTTVSTYFLGSVDTVATPGPPGHRRTESAAQPSESSRWRRSPQRRQHQPRDDESVLPQFLPLETE
jgi:hypothetical protein